MSYRQTSFLAYQGVKPSIAECQEAVLKAIKRLGTCTDHEISEALEWEINRITPRRGELADMGKIVEIGKFIPKGGHRRVTHWRAV